MATVQDASVRYGGPAVPEIVPNDAQRVYRTGCAVCGWRGPWRLNRWAARIDADRHKCGDG
jgi:hypothetical protein